MTARDAAGFAVVALGGAVGAALRHGANLALAGASWPRSTFFVNVAGCLAFGLIAGLSLGRLPESARLMLVTGVLGGFTTFSAFGGETAAMLRQRPAAALAYALGSVAAGLVAVLIAQRAGEWMRR